MKPTDRQIKAYLKKLGVVIGASIGHDDPATENGATVEEHFDRWFGTLNLKLETLRAYRSTLRAVIYPAIGAMRLTDVRKADIDKMLKRAECGASHLNRALSILRAGFQDAVDNKLIDSNPAGAVHARPRPQPAIDPLTPEEAKRLIDAADGWFRNFLIVLLRTGMRPGEALALHWSDICAAESTIHISRTKTRGQSTNAPKTQSSERKVTMVASVRAALEDQRVLSTGDLIFADSSGRMLDLDILRRTEWRDVLRRVGLPSNRVLYSCRHSFVAHNLAAGENPQRIAAECGHSSIEQIIKTYGRWSRKPASRLSADFDQVLSPA